MMHVLEMRGAEVPKFKCRAWEAVAGLLAWWHC